MQVKVANEQVDLHDLISGQQTFKTRLYGATVTTLATNLKWVSLALFDALDSVTCSQGQMYQFWQCSGVVVCEMS